MKLKLCGIRNKEMLEFCAHLPVSYLGINFVPTSKRKHELELPLRRQEIGGISTVGIFANQEPSSIAMMLQKFQINIAQMHGAESPEVAEELHSLMIGQRIWKAFRIDESFDVEKLQAYSNHCELFLFDGPIPGSGQQISDNTKLVKAVQESEKLGVPYGIAGGINAENIAQFVQKFPNATLLDTASGLEVDGKFSETETQSLVTNFYNA